MSAMHPQTQRKAILLDMDGVLVDFFSATLALHGREDLRDNWPAGVWSMAKVMGISEHDFWLPISEAGSKFWSELEWYPWADDLLELCEAAGGFVIATSPSHDRSSAAGKVDSLRERFGPNFRDYMIGPHKHLMAGSGMVLIDDRDTGIHAFESAGGAALRFPRPWNQDHARSHDPIAHVREVLPSLIEGAECAAS